MKDPEIFRAPLRGADSCYSRTLLRDKIENICPLISRTNSLEGLHEDYRFSILCGVKKRLQERPKNRFLKDTMIRSSFFDKSPIMAVYGSLK